MTRFEKDLQEAQKDPFQGVVILKERKAELDSLWKKGKAEKNGFRRQCIAQEYTRLEAEYNEISEWV